MLFDKLNNLVILLTMCNVKLSISKPCYFQIQFSSASCRTSWVSLFSTVPTKSSLLSLSRPTDDAIPFLATFVETSLTLDHIVLVLFPPPSVLLRLVLPCISSHWFGHNYLTKYWINSYLGSVCLSCHLLVSSLLIFVGPKFFCCQHCVLLVDSCHYVPCIRFCFWSVACFCPTLLRSLLSVIFCCCSVCSPSFSVIVMISSCGCYLRPGLLIMSLSAWMAVACCAWCCWFAGGMSNVKPWVNRTHFFKLTQVKWYR